MKLQVLLLLLVLSACLSAPARAARVSDIRNTKHNLSSSGPGTVKAVSEDEVCVFCHTPHGAVMPLAPLWNRNLSGETYTPYTSSSIDATDITAISASSGGSSKLCLACHDGTLAIGAVNVANGQYGVNISMSGTGAGGVMPPGGGEATGFTRDLGIDLTNDHPISFTYDDAVATVDEELRHPSTTSHIGTRAPGFKPVIPLEEGRVECMSCHDPHVRDSDPSKPIKFLRLNRFQESIPTGGSFSESGDILCLACHDKLGQAWSYSAHADSTVADEVYKSGPATLREFPQGIKVWEASCLNCHDTHTVQGARRLLREGTDALGTLSTGRSGGDPAIEQTCYQCHSTAAESILTSVTQVPDIKTEFLGSRRMPIASSDQRSGAEVHDIVDANLTETRENLGYGTGRENEDNRHAECTDCHNPHRVRKNQLFTGAGSSSSGAHNHNAPHSNIASGVLRGAWGVEPVYSSTSFQDLPSSFIVKKGDPGASSSTAVGESWVTREYQICLKCHSNYGYPDNNIYPSGNRPDLGVSGGSTPSGTNGLTQYTNQAKEFQAPTGHMGEQNTSNPSNTGAAGSGDDPDNHRSWHPVMDVTGRTRDERVSGSGLLDNRFFLAPWDGANVGTTTMYCSDCHGDSNTVAGGVAPASGLPWGPHGSSKNFILKADWDNGTGEGSTNDLCFRCHNSAGYGPENPTGWNSGFGGPDENNLHALHSKRIDNALRCVWCHVAVPHGWKNKAFLVNLNDVGPEAGEDPGTEVPIGSWGQQYTKPPYYLNAKLKIRNFRKSGEWSAGNCGSASGNPDVGKDWMGDVCEP